MGDAMNLGVPNYRTSMRQARRRRAIWTRRWRVTLTAAIAVVAGLLMLAFAPALAAFIGWFGGGVESASGGNLEHGAPIARTRCAACHGADGNSPDPRYPKLAGQNQSYLERELQAFKTGARRSDVMLPIATALSDTDAADVAAFFHRQSRTLDAINDEVAAALGERIFLAGSRYDPTCAACHGAGGPRGVPRMGMMGRGMMGSPMRSDAPDIGGQHATYVIDQLNRFASGQRLGTVMGRVAASLSASDRQAVAEYVAGHR